MLIAAKYGSETCLELLLARTSDVNYQRDDGSCALHFVAQNNYPRCVALLLEAGADPNLKNEDGSAAIHYASRTGNHKCLALLLAGGASVNLERSNGLTALMIASSQAQADCVAVLLGVKKVDIGKQMADGMSALHFACLAGDAAADCVSLLLKGGKAKKLTELTGKQLGTPLQAACTAGNAKAVKALVTAGADVDRAAPDGSTALHFAANAASAACITALLDAGANPDLTRKADGGAALHYACAGGAGAVECVRALVAGNADPNLQRNDGASPCHLAAQNGAVEAVQILVRNGANVNSVMPNARAATEGMTKLTTPLDLALQAKQQQCAAAMLKLGASQGRELGPVDGY